MWEFHNLRKWGLEPHRRHPNPPLGYPHCIPPCRLLCPAYDFLPVVYSKHGSAFSTSLRTRAAGRVSSDSAHSITLPGETEAKMLNSRRDSPRATFDGPGRTSKA